MTLFVQSNITENEVRYWRDKVERSCGLYFSDSRINHFIQRLNERIAACGMTDYLNYERYLKLGAKGADEWQKLLEQLLVNETTFFRHKPSFAALTDYVFPQLMNDLKRKELKEIQMWSAGCSTGQEAYSMAMAFLTLMGSRLWRFRVTGTDISLKSLARAKKGFFTQNEIEAVSENYQNTYFVRGEEGNASYQIANWVRASVRFEYDNLFNINFHKIPYQDVIFCQNVLIYFKPVRRNEIVEGLANRLKPGGYLFLGPAEAINLELQGLKPVKSKDALIFQRVK